MTPPAHLRQAAPPAAPSQAADQQQLLQQPQQRPLLRLPPLLLLWLPPLWLLFLPWQLRELLLRHLAAPDYHPLQMLLQLLLLALRVVPGALLEELLCLPCSAAASPVAVCVLGRQQQQQQQQHCLLSTACLLLMQSALAAAAAAVAVAVLTVMPALAVAVRGPRLSVAQYVADGAAAVVVLHWLDAGFRCLAASALLPHPPTPAALLRQALWQ